MKYLYIANWKGYIESGKDALALVRATAKQVLKEKNAEVWVAPSLLHLATVASAMKRSKTLKIGAQTVSPFTGGAHTGFVSARMLKETGAAFVIVGHSERRAMGETGEQIAGQIVEATAAGLAVVLCVGEEKRDKQGDYFAVVEEQLRAALAQYDPRPASRLIIAYEPIWAIGKSASEAMQPEEVHEMSIFIRKTLTTLMERERAVKTQILYGGSVESENAAELLHAGGVSGLLVGHASVSPESFVGIIRACNKK